MGLGKNKCLTKGNEKGTKKKGVGPISKKDWCHVDAPAMFNIRNIGKTLVTRTQGIKIAPDGFRGHVFEVNLADLQNDEDVFRKSKLTTEDVKSKNCFTKFHGMFIPCDKMCSMVKKWWPMMDAIVNVKTTEHYLFHLFCAGFTKKFHRSGKTLTLSAKRTAKSGKRQWKLLIEVQTNDLK
ncbi:40S ribosomal protein S3a-like [Phyllostomus discolor]|uniref:40S ribosomal protein S3a-like n=1 Tax=Phyllostomus discolor TaxID=89673 RepID=A0A7E6CZH5_9CHIR|nr:40S ribosomal protein S3a-like [Phyllostomus discolor]